VAKKKRAPVKKGSPPPVPIDLPNELPKTRINPFSGLGAEELMRYLGVTDWDALIVGDGSGSGVGGTGGWAATMIDRHTCYRRLLLGAMSTCSSYLAELMPTLQAMLWYRETLGRAVVARLAGTGGVATVHVVTDSQGLALTGNKTLDRGGPAAPVWAALDRACGNKYRLVWHWVRRDQVDLNRLTDYLSRQGRLELTAAAIEASRRLTMLDDSGRQTMHNFNPIDDLSADSLPPGAE